MLSCKAQLLIKLHLSILKILFLVLLRLNTIAPPFISATFESKLLLNFLVCGLKHLKNLFLTIAGILKLQTADIHKNIIHTCIDLHFDYYKYSILLGASSTFVYTASYTHYISCPRLLYNILRQSSVRDKWKIRRR